MQSNNRGRGLRPKQAAKYIGVSQTSLWRYARTRSDFPKPIRLTEGVTVFFEAELDAWMAQRAGAVQGAAA
nr:AlpA family phage regulatory protein [Burkholderia mayonis]